MSEDHSLTLDAIVIQGQGAQGYGRDDSHSDDGSNPLEGTDRPQNTTRGSETVDESQTSRSNEGLSDDSTLGPHNTATSGPSETVLSQSKLRVSISWSGLMIIFPDDFQSLSLHNARRKLHHLLHLRPIEHAIQPDKGQEQVKPSIRKSM